MSETPQGLLAPGEMFGDFRVRKELGRGGMGMVYLLEDEETGANYAAKILYPEAEIRDHKDAVGRFLREAEIAMAVEHPNLVHVYAVGRDPETRLGYMIMDYLPGGSLHDLIMERLVRKQGPLPVRQSVALVRQIASALCAIERRGVVHRDIKSENILFGEGGVAMLISPIEGAIYEISLLPKGRVMACRYLGAVKKGDQKWRMSKMVGVVKAEPEKNFFSAELRIPFSEFDVVVKGRGEEWRANFMRVGAGSGGWSEWLGLSNRHMVYDATKFGRVVFGKK